MACVTLKRPIELLGSPHLVEHQPLAKRKRCGPPLFQTTPSPNRGVKRAKRKLDNDDHYSSPSSSAAPVSQFLGTASPINSGKLMAQLEQELKRLQRRKLFTTEESATQAPGSSATSSSSASRDQPLFTLKQVTIVCQRMLKERENRLTEEYDKVLTTKLAEQYDAFVKFSHDQVERRLAESAFSYVS